MTLKKHLITEPTQLSVDFVGKELIRILCILIILQGVVSFRSVPRILNLFHTRTPLRIPWIPHFTSVINWTLRLGLGLLKQVEPISKPWLAVIDHSIDIGTKKALVVLRVTMDALSQKKGAIQLSDCECIGLTICETVNGETTARELKTIFSSAGMPKAIIKDCDSTLDKGVRLFSEQSGVTLPVIQDIGHVMATALKHQFEKTTRYKHFISMTSHGANCLRQTDLAFLIPPKLRSKGRFQSIGKLGKWGEKMLDVFAVKEHTDKDGTLARLIKALPGFNLIRPFIQRFAHTAKVINHVMEILKNKGLDAQTYEQCCELAQDLPRYSKVKDRLLLWLQQHLQIQKELTTLPLMVSSDIIESLFGNFKHINARSPQADMNRSTLLIPTLCGDRDDETVARALGCASQKDLKNWEQENIPYTIRKKRQAFFAENDIQKAGDLLG